MKKFLIVTVVIGAIGVGVFLYLKNKKKNEGTTGSALADNLVDMDTPTTPGAGNDAAPQSEAQQEIVTAAGDFYQTSVKKYFSDSPVPIPGDLTNQELANLQKFCSLKTGTAFNTKMSAGSAFPTIGPANTNINEKWGLANVLHKRSGYAGTAQDYLNKLKVYFKC